MKKLVLAAVLVIPASWLGAQETTVFYAASASVEGVHQSFWVTDARVFNPDPEATITVRLTFLASDTDNTGAAEIEISVGPRQAVALNDLVGTELERSGAGGVRLRSWIEGGALDD